MEQNGGTEKIFCSLMFPLAKNKPSKWVTFMDDLVTLLPQLNKEYHENLNMISQCDKELTDLMAYDRRITCEFNFLYSIL